MDKIDLLTRAIELIYMRHGVPESALEGTSTDAMALVEALDKGANTSGVSTLIFLGLNRMGYEEKENSWDDAEFLKTLAESLA